MQCPNCETINRDGAKFCDECGFPLGGSKSRVNAASPGASAPTSDASGAGIPHEELPTADVSALEVPAVESFQEDEPAADVPAIEVPAVDTPHEDELAADAPAASVSTIEVPVIDESPEQAFEDDWPEEDASKPDIGASGPVSERGRDSQPDDDEDIELGQTALLESVAESDASDESDDFDEAFAGFSVSADEGGSRLYTEGSFEDDGFSRFEGQLPDSTLQMPRVEKDSKSANKDFLASSARSKRPSRIIFIVLGIVVVIAAAAIATYAAGLWGGTIVPDVTGMTESDARAKLEDSGFTVRSMQVKSDDTEGLVLIMDPNGGSRATEGSEVVIHIATARNVPDIVGKSSEEAAKLLADAGYENVRYVKKKSAKDENIVLAVSPEAGTRAKSSMEIVVDISEAYRVPDISGLDIYAAEAAIEEAGLVPQVAYVDTQEYIEGTILGTVPEAGTKVNEGDYVTINVARARGAQLVSLTQQLLAPGGTITLSGANVVIDSLDSVSYLGNDTVAYKITGRPYAVLMGMTVYAPAQAFNGQVVWSPGNEVVSIS